uniref:Regulator of G-protein signaling 20-like n=1 Tax=Paramormyrops kingsleyae TaxID=1676925 RepID=A0A3B3SHW9_9TELE|nr:regulator of G-protein signaling 20-like isoform X1 [Paramormyrops kingsleyae]
MRRSVTYHMGDLNQQASAYVSVTMSALVPPIGCGLYFGCNTCTVGVLPGGAVAGEMAYRTHSILPPIKRLLPCSLTVQNGDGGEGEPSNIKIEEAANCEDSTELTVEEACSWGQSFDRMMSCPAGREAFRSFLRTEFSEENMLFWLACEDLKKETREGAIKEKVRTIYEDYISILSPKEVSLDSRVREMINRNMLEPSSCTFDDAQFQIYTLMQRDSYPRYMASPAYADLLQGLVEKGPRS